MAHALKVPKMSPAGFTASRRRAAAERMRGMLGHDPTRSYTDELIAERRREARAETQAEQQTVQVKRRSAKR